ncbi:hypothetical protein XBP1_390003 [Xenorhabdus bovienii str. puntauvense]|uniref:Uncharacterized protein n=1 Tax=Xenorhabdus bovienii str. puntauvense TaxID=1398201 RepID=A0A077NL06_XENBV|nr:hypothetical protein XBP1_390003 [Xenorhabdus bovienii str. puntauvense]
MYIIDAANDIVDLAANKY